MVHTSQAVSAPLDTPCIEWAGYQMPNGYGQRRFRGKVWLAHLTSITQS